MKLLLFLCVKKIGEFLLFLRNFSSHFVFVSELRYILSWEFVYFWKIRWKAFLFVWMCNWGKDSGERGFSGWGNDVGLMGQTCWVLPTSIHNLEGVLRNLE